MYADNEILFPHYAIPALGEERGGDWRQLIGRVAKARQTSPETLALMSMMIELNGCMPCETGQLPGDARLHGLRATDTAPLQGQR